MGAIMRDGGFRLFLLPLRARARSSVRTRQPWLSGICLSVDDTETDLERSTRCTMLTNTRGLLLLQLKVNTLIPISFFPLPGFVVASKCASMAAISVSASAGRCDSSHCRTKGIWVCEPFAPSVSTTSRMPTASGEKGMARGRSATTVDIRSLHGCPRMFTSTFWVRNRVKSSPVPPIVVGESNTAKMWRGRGSQWRERKMTPLRRHCVHHFWRSFV